MTQWPSKIQLLYKMNKFFIKLFPVALLSLLTACAGYSPGRSLVGQTREFLIAQMGLPEREYASNAFQKLQYPRGPAGWHTYFVYLDQDDRVADWEQVLTEQRFDTLKPGMTRDEVIDSVGISRVRNQLARNRGYLWYYRYENTQCRSFIIEFDGQNTVRGTGYIQRSGRRCHYVGP